MTQSVLITGCSAGGIGSALVEEFHTKGLHVYATARSKSKLAHLKHLANVTILKLDVTSAWDIEAAAEFVRDDAGKLDILINNAGQSMVFPALDSSIENSKKLFDVNLFGPMAVAQAFAPLVIAARGTIVNVCSMSGVANAPWLSVYNASKAGLQSWSETLRLELNPFDVKVISLVTGSVATNLLTHANIRLPENSLYVKATQQIQARGMGQDVQSKDSPAEFASKLASDVLGGTTGLVWRGKMASMICFLSKLAPMWFMDLALTLRTGLEQKTSDDRLSGCTNKDQNASLGRSMPRSPGTTNHNAEAVDSSDVFESVIQAAFAPVVNTDSGNRLKTISTASPLPEDYSGNVQDQLDIQAPSLPDVELETGWDSWLLCDDFNLDAVNSSLLQVTAEGTQRLDSGCSKMVTQPIERSSTPSGDSVRRKWHTYCEPNPARVSPDPTLETGQIDECYREELVERLKPRVQTGILPSTNFIWEVHIASPPEARIAAIQSALIGQAFGFLVGWDRRGIVHGIYQSSCDPTNLVGNALEAAWKEWAIIETKKRIGLAIAIQDAELAKLHHHESVLRHGCQRLSSTASDHLFDAPNANAWKLVMTQESYHSDIPEPSGTTQIPKGVNSFEQCAMLESLSVLACESHQPTVFVSNMAEKCEELLIKWYQSWESAKTSTMIWTSPLMILWHSNFIMLYANLDVLERACGRDGDEIDPDALRYAEQWATSNEAKRCLLHAIYILRQFESIAIGRASSIHLPLCLYQCGIVWYCFGKFCKNAVFSARDAESQFKYSEFHLLRNDESRALNRDSSKWQNKWDTLDQVFGCVDMLRRIPHWKLPQNLASTLLALIEEQDIF
ncbi:SDR family oxidoreductase [Aspergillus affinis]|uniref:SDR family oxidoreductase n=1 Tax=Aspergillus affinis TaxID=1070780 RepID=UPI0022FDD0F8|nr:NAD(P)-binding protein [Aspergillus affinis]KAI9035135.1 NAD(P)-binding protein [Aspergillus affinis]